MRKFTPCKPVTYRVQVCDKIEEMGEQLEGIGAINFPFDYRLNFSVENGVLDQETDEISSELFGLLAEPCLYASEQGSAMHITKFPNYKSYEDVWIKKYQGKTLLILGRPEEGYCYSICKDYFSCVYNYYLLMNGTHPEIEKLTETELSLLTLLLGVSLGILPYGSPGPKGPQGEKGEPGQSLTFELLTPEQQQQLTGPKGDKGDKGDPLTFDQLTFDQLESLRGPAGPKGDTGETGPAGNTGPRGIPGMKWQLVTGMDRFTLDPTKHYLVFMTQDTDFSNFWVGMMTPGETSHNVTCLASNGIILDEGGVSEHSYAFANTGFSFVSSIIWVGELEVGT